MTQLSDSVSRRLPSTTLDNEVAVVLPKFVQQYHQWLSNKPRLTAYQQQLLAWDTRLCLRINLFSHRQRVAQAFKLISRLGDGWAWAAACLVMVGSLLWQGQTALVVTVKLLAVLLTSFCGYLLYKLLKSHTVRPRPYQVHQAIMLGERPLDVFSFPSGHTLQAVLFTIMIGSQLPLMLWWLLPFTLLIALSRLVLGLHYPTDVLVGAGIGATFASIGKGVSNYVIDRYLA